MAVTLIVEDGTGKSNANALVDLAGFKAYCDGQALSYSGFDDDALSGAIVRASAFLANAYKWRGSKVNSRAQTMPFPRLNLYDRDGLPVASNEVPREIVAACSEVALYEATNPGGMNPTVVLSDKVVSEQVDAIRVEYANIFTSAESSRPVLTKVEDLIGAFLDYDSGADITLLRV